MKVFIYQTKYKDSTLKCKAIDSYNSQEKLEKLFNNKSIIRISKTFADLKLIKYIAYHKMIDTYYSLLHRDILK